MLLDRGRRPRAEVGDGARRQRPVHRLRRRRHRCRGRGRDGRQDAQRRRGVHRRQPLLRRRPASLDEFARGSPTRDGQRARSVPASTRGPPCGPLINDEGACAKVDELVEDAVDGWRAVLLGGSARDGPGASTPRPCWATSTRDAADPHEESSVLWRRSSASHTDEDVIRQANDTSRPDRLRLHPRPRQGPAGQRADRGRHGRPQPRRWSRIRPPVRRHQAERPRPRRQHRRHLRVLRDPIHRHQLVKPNVTA